MGIKSLVLIFSLLGAQVACAEKPNTVVEAKAQDEGVGQEASASAHSDEEGEEEGEHLMALVYKGKEKAPLKRDCNLYVAWDEEESVFKIKSNYKTRDNHSPSAVEGAFYFYNADEGLYVETSESVNEEDFSLALAGLSLKGEGEGDPNQLGHYIGALGAEQLNSFFRLDITADASEFMAAAEEAFSTGVVNTSVLSQVGELSIITMHNEGNGHAHPHLPFCTFNELKPELEEVEFGAHEHDHDGHMEEGDHEDHDHEGHHHDEDEDEDEDHDHDEHEGHGHDHDHDHDH